MKNVLPVITLEPGLERVLHNAAEQSLPGQTAVIEPAMAEKLFQALRSAAAKAAEENDCSVLVVAPALRPWLARLVRYRVPDLAIISYSEIPDDQSVKIVLTVEIQNKQ